MRPTPALATTLALVSLLGCDRGSDRKQPKVIAPSAATYTITTRDADLFEGAIQRLAEVHAPIRFDPALDCVARWLVDLEATPLDRGPNLLLYQHVLPVACGSPLLPVHVRVVREHDDVEARLAEVRSYVEEVSAVLPGPEPIAVGVGRLDRAGHARIFVAARPVLELEPVPRTGATVLRGRVTIPVEQLVLYRATADGVEVVAVPHEPTGAFSVAVDGARGADLELAIVSGGTTGPIARLQLGAGAGLIASTEKSLLTAVNAARAALGREPLVERGPPGKCNDIPAGVEGIAVTDQATCHELWSIPPDAVVGHLRYRPLYLQPLLEPEAALVQVAPAAVGPRGSGTVMRVLRRFVPLDATAGRARAIALLRERWPGVEVRAAGPELAALVADFAAAPGTMDALKPRVDAIAGRWTRTGVYYSGLGMGRELAAAVRIIDPPVAPIAVDLVHAQAPAIDGSPHNLIVFVLELPAQ
jgi:hypothetical protein